MWRERECNQLYLLGIKVCANRYWDDKIVSILQDGCGGPEVDSTLVVSSFEHKVSVNSPFDSPAVFNQPIVLILNAIAHQH